MQGPREDYINWDEYFMFIALLSAERSKDPHTQVGSCVVNSENKIVGIGYNGFPIGCSDKELPWNRTSEVENPMESKKFYVCHAEMNAIMNKNSFDLKNCTIFVSLFPCCECAKLIIQSGIRRVVYGSDKYKTRPEYMSSKVMFDKAGVKYERYSVSNRREIKLCLEREDEPSKNGDLILQECKSRERSFLDFDV